MKLAIYGSRRQEAYADQLGNFFTLLSSKGIEVVMHRKLYETLLHIMPARLAAVREVVDTPSFKADIAISIGGDGTFLRTAMWVADKEIPILGINTGHLGYLSSATIDELPDVVNELLNHQFTTSDRSLLQVVNPEIPTWPFALNEVVACKVETASIISAVTSIDGNALADYKADGLIICTPTGSTAYNLSVGGPIMEPTAPVWALTPIAAHSLSMRPLVVRDSAVIDITVEGRAREFRLTLDGRAVSLPIGQQIKLRKAPFAIKIVVRPGHCFPMALREKLHWNE